MPSIAIPQIKWGKRKTRSQMCEVFTEDGRIVDLELDVLHGCVQNTKLDTQDAHLLSAENQFFDVDDHVWKQQINELSASPICLIEPKAIQNLNARVNMIFRDRRESTMIMRHKAALKSALVEKVTLLVSIVCATFIIIAGIHYFGG